MSPWIVKKPVGDGVRYEVRFRLGGRGPQLYGGRFRTKREAEARARWIDGELAAMRVPNIRALRDAGPPRRLGQVAEEWAASRIDVRPETARNYRKHFARWGELADMDPHAVTVADVQALIGRLADLKPSSVKRYLTTLAQVLDFAGVEPNPVRDRNLRRPKVERVEIEPPSAAEVEAIVANVRSRWRLPILLLEATAMRIGELCALEWDDVDFSQSRFRIREGKSAAARRFVQVPADLLAVVGETPPDDRRGLVFDGMTGQDLRQAMKRACRAAGIPVHSPHDLRHRRISLWHAEGVPFREIAARVGHARTSLTVDTYTHVILGEEG